MNAGLKRGLKKVAGLALLAGALTTLGGCVYGPGYYQRPGVVYDDAYGRSSGPAYDDDDYYYDGYPGYYSPYAYAWPWVGLGFYGNYYYGGHRGYRGPWRGGYHGSSNGGTWHGTSHSTSGSHSSGGHPHN